VKVHPNPFSDFTTFRIYGKEIHDKVDFELFDLRGQLVKEASNISGSQYQMSGKGLTPGIYLFKFSSESHAIEVGKVIVN